MKKLSILLPLVITLFGCDAQSSAKQVETTAESLCGKGEFVLSLPKDMDQYKQKMADFIQAGGTDPFDKTAFTDTCKKPRNGKIDLKDIAEQAALATLPYQDAAKVLYFKQKKETLYIVLSAQENGWAGVSTALGTSIPVIIRNIQLNSSIKNIKFGYAPGDEDLAIVK